MKKAAALKWNREKDDAPRILASGKGFLAERIEQVAREAGLPLMENTLAAEALSSLEAGEEIPPEFFKLAAELYIFLMEVEEGLT